MTVQDDPRIEAAAARVRQAAQQRAAAYGAPPWEPLWKRSRTPKSKAQKMQKLHQQRQRLQEAGRRRLAAAESRRPRARPNRIGSAAARRDAQTLSRMRHSTARLR